MSDAQHPPPLWVRALLLMYLFAAPLWCLGNLYVSMLGPCPAFSSNTQCEWSAFERAWYFPLSQLIALALWIPLRQILKATRRP